MRRAIATRSKAAPSAAAAPAAAGGISFVGGAAASSLDCHGHFGDFGAVVAPAPPHRTSPSPTLEKPTL